MGNINWEYAIGIVGVIATVWGILYIIKPNLKYTIEILPFVNPKDVDKNIILPAITSNIIIIINCRFTLLYSLSISLYVFITLDSAFFFSL